VGRVAESLSHRSEGRQSVSLKENRRKQEVNKDSRCSGEENTSDSDVTEHDWGGSLAGVEGSRESPPTGVPCED
jgi:hypothetical protein